MIGKLLHIANSGPAAINKDRFYAMKARILKGHGNPDGFDIQHIEGKGCWTCYGTGIYIGYHTFSFDEWEDTCNRCWGSGWFKYPAWIILDRHRLGGFVFHTPSARYNRKEAIPIEYRDCHAISGYIEHDNGYTFRQEFWAAFALGLMFDRGFAWMGFKQAVNGFWIVQRWKRWRIRRQASSHLKNMSRKDLRTPIDDTEVPF